MDISIDYASECQVIFPMISSLNVIADSHLQSYTDEFDLEFFEILWISPYNITSESSSRFCHEVFHVMADSQFVITFAVEKGTH